MIGSRVRWVDPGQQKKRIFQTQLLCPLKAATLVSTNSRLTQKHNQTLIQTVTIGGWIFQTTDQILTQADLKSLFSQLSKRINSFPISSIDTLIYSLFSNPTWELEISPQEPSAKERKTWKHPLTESNITHPFYLTNIIPIYTFFLI
jgi:hypothetical protein